MNTQRRRHTAYALYCLLANDAPRLFYDFQTKSCFLMAKKDDELAFYDMGNKQYLIAKEKDGMMIFSLEGSSYPVACRIEADKFTGKDTYSHHNFYGQVREKTISLFDAENEQLFHYAAMTVPTEAPSA